MTKPVLSISVLGASIAFTLRAGKCTQIKKEKIAHLYTYFGNVLCGEEKHREGWYLNL